MRDVLADEIAADHEPTGPGRFRQPRSSSSATLPGSGVDWPTTTGLTDEATIRTLRSIQRKLAKVVRRYYGKHPGE